MLLTNNRVSTERFSYHRDLKTFTAEASDLNHTGCNFLGRLYDDAADVGFCLVSHKTGAVEPFYLDNVDRDREGDVRAWEFLPVNKALREGGIKLTIFND